MLAPQATVDVLLVSQNQGRYEQKAAERVVAAIHRGIKDGRLSRKTVQAALDRVETFRRRITP